MFVHWLSSSCAPYAPYVSMILSVTTLQILAVISPGPDFAIVTRNSILHSRKAGVSTALGIVAGSSFHLFYLVCGFGFLAAHLARVLFYIKFAGCLYLGFLGWKSLRSTYPKNPEVHGAPRESGKRHSTQASPDVPGAMSESISWGPAFWSGFLTNILNPKAILFLLSLFTVVIDRETPVEVLLICGTIIVVITLAWYLFVSLSFSGVLRASFLKFGRWIDRVTGGFLLFVSAKLGLSLFE